MAMLPASYELPAAVVLLLGGAVACFLGHRFFRIVLALVGFILGLIVAGSIFGTGDTWPLVGVAIGGGVIGALLLFAAYYVGVSLVGAGLGVVVGNLGFSALDREPHLLMVMLFAVVGAIAAMYLQRYFIVVGTAFGGAWAIIVGAMALAGDPAAAAAAASGQVWTIYPLDPGPGQRWLPMAWVVLGIVGTVVQLTWTGGGRRKK